VATDLEWRWIPGDSLVNAMRGVTTDESHPALHVAAGGRHVEYFTEGPPEKLIADARALQETAWPGFAHVIRFHAKYGPSVVIESWTFSPYNVAALRLDNVRAVWIVIDLDVLDDREEPPPGYVDPSPDPERRRTNFRHRSAWTNSFVEEAATRLDLTILRQDGTQSVADHVAAIRELTGAVIDPPRA
jgi:hypothetical protein